MIPRLFVEADLSATVEIPLTEAQAHYLAHVLRRAPGDPVLLFNGRDGEWRAEIAEIGKRGGLAHLLRPMRRQTPGPDLHLLFAPVKRAALDAIVQKAVELGVARIRPVVTERTVVARVRTDRLQSVAIEAAEQCGRMDAPEVAEPEKLATALDGWPKERRIMFCDEAQNAPPPPALAALSAFQGAAPAPWAVLTGPEGGFSPDEQMRLRALSFVTPVGLGPRILRADTAVFTALALWQAALGDLGPAFKAQTPEH